MTDPAKNENPNISNAELRKEISKALGRYVLIRSGAPATGAPVDADGSKVVLVDVCG